MNQKETIGRWILAISVGAILCAFMSIIVAVALVKPALSLFNLTSSPAFPTVIVYIESGLETLLGYTLGGLAAVHINHNRRPFITACLASLLGLLIILSVGIGF
ncbi:MAG: hypothetical protein GTN65_02780, partial [Armatimonadetes bacterium]|nr:hypothetical protein [Armatimonadota bacterium]NIO96031.1 hypothetical protein [Armatimonadota bacterium]